MKDKPAFPMPSGDEPKVDRTTHYNEGMTLHQWFAGMVLNGFCSNPSVFAPNGMTGWGLVDIKEDQLMNYCLYIADKMIAEYEKREKP